MKKGREGRAKEEEKEAGGRVRKRRGIGEGRTRGSSKDPDCTV